jgi:hypothetical protein
VDFLLKNDSSFSEEDEIVKVRHLDSRRFSKRSSQIFQRIIFYYSILSEKKKNDSSSG